MKEVKAAFYNRINSIIKNNTTLANNKIKDNNFVSLVILISHLVKTTQLIITILCVSYFFGIFWFIFCDITTKTEEEQGLRNDPGEDYFLITFDVYDQAHSESIVMLTYFAFTSLSTVGLGDYHPRSNKERLAGAFILLFGVAITSYIMDNFNGMIMQFNRLNKSFEEENKLSLFFGTIERFNKEKKFSLTVKTDIEKYFNYRWSHFRN